MADAVDVALAAVAAKQHGQVTRAQLLALGINDNAIVHRLKAGRLHRVYPGVYGVGKHPVTPLERACAAVLACGPGGALSHRSAMSLWGFLKRWETPLHVTVLGDRRPRGIQVHRSRGLTRRDLTRQFGIRVTSPARTLLDAAPSLADKTLKRAVNDARHSRYLHLPDLGDVIERCPRHLGAKRLSAVLSRPGGPTRSEWEDFLPAFCEWHELPQPLMSVKVAGYEVDAFFPVERLIVELDSWEHHSSRDAFERDRDRDADSLAAGFETVRITWDRMMRTPSKEAKRLDVVLRARRTKPSEAARPAEAAY